MMHLILFSLTPFLANMASIIYVLLAIFVICYFLKKISQSNPFKKFLLKMVNLFIMTFYSNSSVVRIQKAIYTANLWIGAIDEAIKNTLKKFPNTSMLAYLVTLLKCVYWQTRKLIYKIVMKINSALLLPFTVKKRLTPVTTLQSTDFPNNEFNYFL